MDTNILLLNQKPGGFKTMRNIPGEKIEEYTRIIKLFKWGLRQRYNDKTETLDERIVKFLAESESGEHVIRWFENRNYQKILSRLRLNSLVSGLIDNGKHGLEDVEFSLGSLLVARFHLLESAAKSTLK